MVHVFRQFPWIISTVLSLPEWIGEHMGSGLKAVVNLRSVRWPLFSRWIRTNSN